VSHVTCEFFSEYQRLLRSSFSVRRVTPVALSFLNWQARYEACSCRSRSQEIVSRCARQLQATVPRGSGYFVGEMFVTSAGGIAINFAGGTPFA
jgi:hypothetical protein